MYDTTASKIFENILSTNSNLYHSGWPTHDFKIIFSKKMKNNKKVRRESYFWKEVSKI